MIDPKEERKFRTLMRHIALDYDGSFDVPYDMFVCAAWLEGNKAGDTFADHSDSLEHMSTNVFEVRIDGELKVYTGVPSPEEYNAHLLKDPAAVGRRVAAQVEHVRKLKRDHPSEEGPFGEPNGEEQYDRLKRDLSSRFGIAVADVHGDMTQTELEALGRRIIDGSIAEMRDRAAREREFMDRWPDLREYCREYSSMSPTKLETLVGKAAERFSTALLSRETLTGEECEFIVWQLCDWAYVIGAYDKVAAMHRKGRLFSDEFPRLVTMADKPDYETRGEWTEKALDVMNGEIVRHYAQRAAEKALEEVLEGDRGLGRGVPDLDDYLDKQGLTIDHSEARLVKVITAVRAMQQEGMKNGLNLFRGYWEEDPSRRSRALDYLGSDDSIDSWKYFDPVETVEGQTSRA